MKKLAVLIAVVTLAALAAPAFSATNPFMDVPMNHWAYDAIGQLAAHNILSGYPDGLYRGKQPATRYEMASALARALAVVDMTKASKQDVEMLKRLVVEFKDELEALGVRVDELDERVRVLESRLGGWHIHGTLVLDVTYRKENEATDASWSNEGDGSVTFDEARLFFERTWGENDEYFFRARLRDEGGNNARFDRFYVDMPFFFDSKLTVGRFAWAWENAYRIDPFLGSVATGTWTNDSIMADWKIDGFGFTKNFGLGTFQAVVAHPNQFGDGEFNTGRFDGDGNLIFESGPSTWMLGLNASMQFTEQFGLDLGGVAFMGDNSDSLTGGTDANGKPLAAEDDYGFDKMWMFYAGLRFNFNENVAFKGVFYKQKIEGSVVDTNDAGNLYWRGLDSDPNHWALMVDVKQEALKFTSLWLEYGQYDAGFSVRSNSSIFVSSALADTSAPDDMKYWRIAAGQEWNDKWATHLFYYGYKFDNIDRKPAEMGVGVQYHLNDSTTMGLNYMHVKGDDYKEDDDQVRFRTSIAF